MRISYIGNFRPDFSTESHVSKSLEQLGHIVFRYQEDDFNDKDLLEAVLRDKSDLLLYTRTWGIAGDGMWLFNTLHLMGIPTASYHLDLYVGLDRGDIRKLERDPFWHTKYVFTVDGDPQSAEVFKHAGINHFYLRAGVYGEECYLAEPDRVKYPHDIIFVGARTYHPEWPYRVKLLDWLQSAYGERFHRYGHPEVTIRGHDLNVLYASAKVVVGDSLVPGFTHTEYWSDRVYETTGRGGFIIHPRIKGLETDFTDGEHLKFYDFNDFEGLKNTIDYYLEHDDERENIRRSGQYHTSKHFNYCERMKSMLKQIGEFEPKIKILLKH